MDVVKTTIDSLHGSIEIDSEKGKGTEIVIRIPQTLSIIDGLLVRSGDRVFVLPLENVEELVDGKHEGEQNRMQRIMNYRGGVLPCVNMRELFPTQSGEVPRELVVVVTAGEQKLGLVVDQALGIQQTVVKSLGSSYRPPWGIVGVTVLPDGSVGLIVDTGRIIEMAHQA